MVSFGFNGNSFFGSSRVFSDFGMDFGVKSFKGRYFGGLKAFGNVGKL